MPSSTFVKPCGLLQSSSYKAVSPLKNAPPGARRLPVSTGAPPCTPQAVSPSSRVLPAVPCPRPSLSTALRASVSGVAQRPPLRVRLIPLSVRSSRCGRVTVRQNFLSGRAPPRRVRGLHQVCPSVLRRALGCRLVQFGGTCCVNTAGHTSARGPAPCPGEALPPTPVPRCQLCPAAWPRVPPGLPRGRHGHRCLRTCHMVGMVTGPPRGSCALSVWPDAQGAAGAECVQGVVAEPGRVDCTRGA